MILSDMPRYVRWSQQAIECYLSGCNCSECIIKKYFDSVTTIKYHPRCHMKESILELMRNVGKPTQNDIDRVFKDQKVKEELCHKYHNLKEKLG